MELGSVTQSVTVEAGAPLIQASPSRGGNFLSREVRDLPLVSLSPISLARTLPGVIQPAGSFTYAHTGGEGTTWFSVNGQRPRANNYLLDSTENNEIAFTGVAQPFNIADAVEEVSVQTGNFGVEFGRAGGGVFNVVTKSGTNSLHGTLLWRYQSQRFNSVSNVDKLNQTPKSVFSHNVYGFTLGGPVRSDKTFFFAGFQQDTLRSTQNVSLVVPTEAAVATLRSLFPSNPRLDLYLDLLGSLRGSASPIPLQLGADPSTGVDRGPVQFASASLALPASNEGPQWLMRLDHNLSEAHRLALRYVYDSRTQLAGRRRSFFPGFVTDQAARNQNLLFTDHYTFSPTWTNEFRFSYARHEAEHAANFAPIRPAGADAAENHHPVNRYTWSSIDFAAVPAGKQPVVSGDANEAGRTPHVSLRRGVLEAVGDPAPRCPLPGRAYLHQRAGLLRFRQLPGRFQRTFRSGAERLWRDSFPSRSVPPDLLFPGHVAAGAFAEPDTGAPL